MLRYFAMSKLSTQELFGKYCTKKEHSLQVEKLCNLIFDEVNKKLKNYRKLKNKS